MLQAGTGLAMIADQREREVTDRRRENERAALQHRKKVYMQAIGTGLCEETRINSVNNQLQ